MEEKFDYAGWTFEVKDDSDIASEAYKDGWGGGDVKRFPGMFFHQNGIQIQWQHRSIIDLTAEACLSTVRKSTTVPPGTVPVRALEANVESIPVVDYDWTFEPRLEDGYVDDPQASIDYARLSRTDEPILFYGESVLYEDELSDCGSMTLGIKLRVMPSGWFVLLTHATEYYADMADLNVVSHACKEWRFHHVFQSDHIAVEVRSTPSPEDNGGSSKLLKRINLQ
jgi:hypothetical protein